MPQPFEQRMWLDGDKAIRFREIEVRTLFHHRLLPAPRKPGSGLDVSLRFRFGLCYRKPVEKSNYSPRDGAGWGPITGLIDRNARQDWVFQAGMALGLRSVLRCE